MCRLSASNFAMDRSFVWFFSAAGKTRKSTVTTPATATWRYGPAPRFEGESQEPAIVALMRSKAAHGIGKQVKGRVVFGRPGTRSLSALPRVEPTRVRA